MKPGTRILAVAILILVGITATLDLNAQSDSARADRGITQQQADAILDELKAIRQLLANQAGRPGGVPAKQPATKVEMSVGNDWNSMGREDAPITVVEFADYQCPFCRRFQSDTFAELRKNYVDSGKVRFVARDLPLQFHGNAQQAAEAARCAGEQGKYWEMRDTLISNAKDLNQEKILQYAQSLSLEASSFQSCVVSEKHRGEIQKDVADATALQISGTPSFVVGKVSSGVLKGTLLVGAQPYSTFENAINEALKGNP